jgi:cytidylate kinase
LNFTYAPRDCEPGIRTDVTSEDAVADLIRRTVLEPDEMLVSIHVPPPGQRTSSHYIKLKERQKMDIAFVGDHVLLNDRDVTEAIRTPDVSEGASRVAANPSVRDAMVQKQRELLADSDWVAEGRDIGTVVAPGAEVKIYLQADPQVRASRRLAERPEIGADALATDLRLRDESDAARMQPAPDAIEIDTTSLEVEDVVDRIEALVRERSAA